MAGLESVTKSRYLETPIREDAEAKMVFLGGPRQVGKTTLAHIAASHSKSAVYLGALGTGP